MPQLLRRAALYHRVSTLDQDPTLAREDLRGAARARGYEVVLDIEETGTGARNDRPGLQQVMEAARRGKLEAVLCWKLDRFGRSVLDVLSNVQMLERAGIIWIATTQGIEIRPEGDAVSRLLLTMLAGVAEFERDLIRERTRAGMAKVRARGGELGRPVVSVEVDVLAARAAGQSWESLAEQAGCSEATLRRRARASGKPAEPTR